MVDLQCCANLCCTEKWLWFIHIYTFFLKYFFHYNLALETGYHSLYYAGRCCLSILCVIAYICQWQINSPSVSLPPPLGTHKPVLYVWGSVSVFQTRSLVSYFRFLYKWHHMVLVFLFLTYIIQCDNLCCCCCLVTFDSLWPHGLYHARLPCPSPTPRDCSNSCPFTQWCHLTISSSVFLFSSCLLSFLASGSFPMSQLFSSGGQSVGASASASVLPMNV